MLIDKHINSEMKKNKNKKKALMLYIFIVLFIYFLFPFYRRQLMHIYTIEAKPKAWAHKREGRNTQYCGSINLNKVNFCRKASEYENSVFCRLGKPAGQGSCPEYRLSIFYTVYRYVCVSSMLDSHAFPCVRVLLKIHTYM